MGATHKDKTAILL